MIGVESLQSCVTFNFSSGFLASAEVTLPCESRGEETKIRAGKRKWYGNSPANQVPVKKHDLALRLAYESRTEKEG